LLYTQGVAGSNPAPPIAVGATRVTVGAFWQRSDPGRLRRVGKVLFIPVSLLSGLLAGLLGRRLFEGLWGLFDQEEPPDPEHREISWLKLVLAHTLSGAVFGGIRGVVDHAARVSFYRATGAWPGEERPERTA
jgi:hypothetical protein